MNLLLLCLAIGLVASDKLDRTYLPPPGSKFSGGSPGDIQVPFEFPKEPYSTTARPVQIGSNGLPTLGDSRIELGINRGLGQLIDSSRNILSTPKTPFSHFQTSPTVPTTTTTYAFTQTTTIPPFDGYETTTGAFSSVIPGFPTTGSLAEMQYQQPDSSYAQTSLGPYNGQTQFRPEFARHYNGSQDFNQQVQSQRAGLANGGQGSNIAAQIPTEGQVLSKSGYPQTNEQEFNKYKLQRPGVTGNFTRYPESQYAVIQPGSPIDKIPDFSQQNLAQNIDPTFSPSITQPQPGFQKGRYEGDLDNIQGVVSSKPRVPSISYLPGQDTLAQQGHMQPDVNKPSYRPNQYQGKDERIPVQQYPSSTGNQFEPSRGKISENIQRPDTTVTPSTFSPGFSFPPGVTSTTFLSSPRSREYSTINAPTLAPSPSGVSYPYASTHGPTKEPVITGIYPSITGVTNKPSDTAGYPGILEDGSPNQAVEYTTTQQPAFPNQPSSFIENQTPIYTGYHKTLPGSSSVEATRLESYSNTPASDFTKRPSHSGVHTSYVNSNLNQPSLSNGYPNTLLPGSSNQSSGPGVYPTITAPGFSHQPSAGYPSTLAPSQSLSGYPSTPTPSFANQPLPYQPYNEGDYSSASEPGSLFATKELPISPVSGSLTTSTLKSTNIPLSGIHPTSSPTGIPTDITVLPSSGSQYHPTSGDFFSTPSPSFIDQPAVSGSYRTPSRPNSSGGRLVPNAYPSTPGQSLLGQKLSPAISKHPERPQSEDYRNAAIISYENVITPDGFAYSYDTSNGIHADETGTATDGVKAKGGYSYTGDDGKVYTVTYSADENGFQPQGDHLPTPPPIPDAILKVIEQNAKEKELGVVDDGFYDDVKYGHNKYQGLIKNYKKPKYNSPTSNMPETQERGLSRDDRKKYGTRVEGKPVSSAKEDEAFIDEEVQYDDGEENENSRPIELKPSRRPYTKVRGQDRPRFTGADRRISDNRGKPSILSDEDSNTFDKPKIEGSRYPNTSTINKYLPGSSNENIGLEVADNENPEGDKYIESQATDVENLDNGRYRPTHHSRLPVTSENKYGNDSQYIRRPGVSRTEQNRLLQRRPYSKKPVNEEYEDNTKNIIKQPDLHGREQYKGKPKEFTKYDQSGKKIPKGPGDDEDERYEISDDSRVKSPSFERNRVVRPQSPTSHHPGTDGIEHERIQEQGYEYKPPQRKFFTETTTFPSRSSEIKEVVPTSRPSQTDISYEKTNKNDEKGKPFMTPNVSREEDTTEYEYDTDIPSTNSHKLGKVRPVDQDRHDSTLKGNAPEYNKEGASDQDINDDRVTPTRVPAPESSRIGASRRPSYETKSKPYNQQYPSADRGFEYGKPGVSQETFRSGQKNVSQYPDADDTKRPGYFSSITTPMPSRVSTRYGSNPQDSYKTTSRYSTTSRPLETSKTPDYSIETFAPGKTTDSIKPGKPSQRPLSPDHGKQTTSQDHVPSTTYRPNYTIVHKPRTSAPSIVVDAYGRPIATEQPDTPSDTNVPRIDQPSRDDINKGQGYQPEYGLSVTKDSRVPSRERPEFEQSYPSVDVQGQSDTGFEENVEKGHGDPSYPSSYNKVKGEDFSGPKQHQRFDPKTGYHYK